MSRRHSSAKIRVDVYGHPPGRGGPHPASHHRPMFGIRSVCPSDRFSGPHAHQSRLIGVEGLTSSAQPTWPEMRQSVLVERRWFNRQGGGARGDPYDAWGPATYFFEIDESAHPVRNLEVSAGGQRLRYRNGHRHDAFGMLSDQPRGLDDFAPYETDSSEFDAEWSTGPATNVDLNPPAKNDKSRLRLEREEIRYEKIPTAPGRSVPRRRHSHRCRTGGHSGHAGPWSDARVRSRSAALLETTDPHAGPDCDRRSVANRDAGPRGNFTVWVADGVAGCPDLHESLDRIRCDDDRVRPRWRDDRCGRHDPSHGRRRRQLASRVATPGGHALRYHRDRQPGGRCGVAGHRNRRSRTSAVGDKQQRRLVMVGHDTYRPAHAVTDRQLPLRR